MKTYGLKVRGSRTDGLQLRDTTIEARQASCEKSPHELAYPHSMEA